MRLAALSRSIFGKVASRIQSPLVASSVAVAVLSGSLWIQGETYIEDVSSTLNGIRELVAGDSEHYLAIAESMREGDLSMSHVSPTGGADRAHRQPGFPAMLALAGKLGLRGAPDLARVNLGMMVLALWAAFAGVASATGSALAGLVAAAVLYDARFLFDIATNRLLTEPLFVAVAVAALTSCLSYIRRQGATSLLCVAGFGAAAYLVRVNGLFLAGSLGVAIVGADVIRLGSSRSDSHGVRRLPWSAYAIALVVFVLVATPSWLPRLLYAGDPIYHGYLPNYLWVDDYDRAHVAGPPRYTLATYAKEHSIEDAMARASAGVSHVFLETPRDKFGVVTCVALLASLATIVILRETSGLLIALAAILQALPLVWTAMSNPVRRLPAAALLPFASVLIGIAANALLRRAVTRARSTEE